MKMELPWLQSSSLVFLSISIKGFFNPVTVSKTKIPWAKLNIRSLFFQKSQIEVTLSPMVVG